MITVVDITKRWNLAKFILGQPSGILGNQKINKKKLYANLLQFRNINQLKINPLKSNFD